MTTQIKFPLVSGNISIDLVNTEVIRHGTLHDLLSNKKHILAWFDVLVKEKIIFKEHFSEDIELWADIALPLLREMRSFLRKGYEKMADGDDLSPEWITSLELLTRKTPFSYQLKDNGLIPVPIGKPEDMLVSLVALDALKLISSNKLSNIHRCANPDCVLLFIDTRGRRKWCSMKLCGNRNKVTRHKLRNAEK